MQTNPKDFEWVLDMRIKWWTSEDLVGLSCSIVQIPDDHRIVTATYSFWDLPAMTKPQLAAVPVLPTAQPQLSTWISKDQDQSSCTTLEHRVIGLMDSNSWRTMITMRYSLAPLAAPVYALISQAIVNTHRMYRFYKRCSSMIYRLHQFHSMNIICYSCSVSNKRTNKTSSGKCWHHQALEARVPCIVQLKPCTDPTSRARSSRRWALEAGSYVTATSLLTLHERTLGAPPWLQSFDGS